VLIDWFTVAAQVLNFVVLVALLKHFLYGRIIHAMDAREEKVASRLEEAEEQKRQAAQEAESFREKRRELEDKKEDMLDRAKKDAEAQRKEMVGKYRDEVADLRDKWQADLEREQESFFREVREQTLSHVFRISRKAVENLADADLEKQVVPRFLENLQDLKEEDLQGLRTSARESEDGLKVLTRFEMSTGDRKRVTQALHEHLDRELEISYGTSGDVVLGVALVASGHRVAWDLSDYLDELEDSLRSSLEKRSARQEKDGPEQSEGARSGKDRTERTPAEEGGGAEEEGAGKGEKETAEDDE